MHPPSPPPAYRRNQALMTVFFTLIITLTLLSAGVYSPHCHKAAGYIGFFCGASAIYACFAYMYKDEVCVCAHRGRMDLPCWTHAVRYSSQGPEVVGRYIIPCFFHL